MGVLVTVSDSAMQRALYDLARITKKEFSVVVRREARLIAVQLARVTHPYGGSEGNSNPEGGYSGTSDRMMGEAAVRRDISRLYAPAFVAFQQIRDNNPEAAKAFWKAFQDNNWKEAERIVRESGGRWRNVPVERFDKSLHKKNRNRQGRVSRHVPAQIITNPKAMNAYREKEVKLVGFAKGGWAAAARGIGGMRGIPQWVTRHSKAGMGNAVDNSNNSDNPHVLITNSVPYISKVCPQSARDMALRIQRNKMFKHIEKVVSNSIKQADLA
jgi:hypothetical protein